MSVIYFFIFARVLAVKLAGLLLFCSLVVLG